MFRAMAAAATVTPASGEQRTQHDAGGGDSGVRDALSPAKESIAQLVNILRAMPTPGSAALAEAGADGGGGGDGGGAMASTLSEILRATTSQVS